MKNQLYKLIQVLTKEKSSSNARAKADGGGGERKSKWATFDIPRALSCNTAHDRSDRHICITNQTTMMISIEHGKGRDCMPALSSIQRISCHDRYAINSNILLLELNIVVMSFGNHFPLIAGSIFLVQCDQLFQLSVPQKPYWLVLSPELVLQHRRRAYVLGMGL